MSSITVTLNRQESNVQRNVPGNGRYSNWTTSVARNINRIVLPTIAILAASALPVADAALGSYTACMAMCLAAPNIVVYSVGCVPPNIMLSQSITACMSFCQPTWYLPW